MRLQLCERQVVGMEENYPSVTLTRNFTYHMLIPGCFFGLVSRCLNFSFSRSSLICRLQISYVRFQFRKQVLISDDELHDKSSDLVLMFRFQVQMSNVRHDFWIFATIFNDFGYILQVFPCSKKGSWDHVANKI